MDAQDVAIMEKSQQPDAVQVPESANRPEWKPTLHELLFLVSLAAISLMVSLDATILVTSLSTMITALGGRTTQAFWVGTSYLLSYAVTMPYTAALSDIFGRPICLLVSLSSFDLGSIVCCVAKNLLALLVGRCFQGVGGGGIIILALDICTDIVPLRYRAKYYGIIQAAWAIGTCLGPLLGGAFVEHSTWRWIFYLMFPFCFIGFVSIPWLLTLKPRTSSLKEKLLRIDITGGVLFIGSSTSFLVALSWGGTQEPWGSFRKLVPLILGAVGLGATMVWEGLCAKEPFLRKSLFHCRSSYAAFAGAFAQGLLLYGQLYYIPFYFSSVRAFSPIRTGIALFPLTFAFIPSSLIIGSLNTRLNRFRWALWIGWLIATIGIGLTLLWDLRTPTAAWVVIGIVVGVGHGFVLNAQNFATQAICLPGDEAAAAAMYAFLRSFGMAIGVSIGSTVFQNVMLIKLNELSLPADIAEMSESYVTVHNILHACTYGFRGVYGFFTGISGMAALMSMLIGRFDLNKELETEHRLEDNEFLRRVQGTKKPQQDVQG
ncbi:major facilitator superfamily transporter [Exophiala viscosa]|uniref:major facilitator superfamily transporter n=1 Tax=Exophiala viscosa TaxID=2486360 RepID=UPI00219694B1|nr:major facilitator superfamily transporter [Exophiala viscosa]